MNSKQRKVKKIILITFFTGLALGAILMLFQQAAQRQHMITHNERTTMKKIYMVKIVGRGAPNVEHETYKSAAQEAERLVKLYRHPAIILQKVAECRPAPEVIWEGEPQEVEE